MRVRGLPTGSSGRGPPAAVKKTFDVQRIAKAIAGPGVDTRFWFSAGTVGVFTNQGEFVTSGVAARDAIAVEADGALVDVRLEPSGEFVSARYHGVRAGRWAVILAPLAPGDEVLVAIPDGDPNNAATSIVAVLANATAPIPSDWANDRLLIDGLVVPVHIRGPAVSIESPNLFLNGRRVARSSEPL